MTSRFALASTRILLLWTTLLIGCHATPETSGRTVPRAVAEGEGGLGTPAAAEEPESFRGISEGARHMSEAMMAVLRLKAHVVECSKLAAGRGKRAKGVVLVRFVVDAEGAVTESEVARSTVQSPAVEQCVVEVTRRMQFEPIDGGLTTFTFPFRYNSSGT